MPSIKLIKISFIIILFLLLITKNKYDDFTPNIKVCLCSPAKKENRYLREFVEHYKSYNVDKIFLYDNNDINGEHFEEVINDYVQSGFVIIKDFRGKKNALYEMMNNCYKNNYLVYDWMIFYEIDEYIYLKNYTNIKKFLSEKKFEKCETIQLNWLMHTDNNQIYYENKPIKIRFPYSKKNVSIAGIKSILKGKIPNININCVHKLNYNLITCDGFGNRTNITGAGTFNLDYEYYYIDHYFCKSTEEFINKINKGDVLFSMKYFQERIKVYFSINNVTKEKADYMEKHLCTNISLKSFIKNYKF